MDTHIKAAILEALRLVGEERLWPVLIQYVSVSFVVFGNPCSALPSESGKQGKRKTEYSK